MADRRWRPAQAAEVEHQPAKIIKDNLYNLFSLLVVVLLLYSSGYQMAQFDARVRGMVVCRCREGLKEQGCWWSSGWWITALAIPDTPAGVSDLSWGSAPTCSPHLSLLGLSFACVAKLWSRGAHCAGQTVALLLEPATPPGGL